MGGAGPHDPAVLLWSRLQRLGALGDSMNLPQRFDLASLPLDVFEAIEAVDQVFQDMIADELARARAAQHRG